MSELKPGTPETCHNYFHSSNSSERFTHIRFNLYPDGGVARLHVYGSPKFDWASVPASEVFNIFCYLIKLSFFFYILIFNFVEGGFSSVVKRR